MRWKRRVESVKKVKQVRKMLSHLCAWTYEGGKAAAKGGGGGGGGCTTLFVPSFCEISWGTVYAVVSNGLPALPPFPVSPPVPPLGGA